ncbi:MAG TPA: DUF2062 domain-containing protein [Methylophilaceae bacterium]|jgi:uncharacterized protein (DUF2062 family)
MSFNFSRWLPKRHEILESRWLKPFHEHLHDRRLWRLERYATARGAAIGLFFAFIVPIGQIPLSVIASIAFRANIPVAVLGTFVTNPFTFPVVFWAAYSIGSLLLGRWNTNVDKAIIEQSDKVTPEAAITHHDFWEWLDSTITWLSNAGLPFLLGTIVLAILGAIIGYMLTHAIWQLRSTFRRQRVAKNRKKRMEQQ